MRAKTLRLYMAAKALENAALLSSQQPKGAQEAADLYRKTSDYYLAHGSADRAADCLEKAARYALFDTFLILYRAMENINVEKALEYYTEALSLIESEDRPRSGVDVFKRAINLATKQTKYVYFIEKTHNKI